MRSLPWRGRANPTRSSAAQLGHYHKEINLCTQNYSSAPDREAKTSPKKNRQITKTTTPKTATWRTKMIDYRRILFVALYLAAVIGIVWAVKTACL